MRAEAISDSAASMAARISRERVRRKIRLTFCGKRQPPRRAVDQPDTKALLQSHNEFRDRRGWKADVLSCGSEAAAFNHPLEHTHFIGSIGHR